MRPCKCICTFVKRGDLVMPVDTTLTPEECNCLAVRSAARHVTQFYDELLAPTGLRTTQFLDPREAETKGAVYDQQACEGHGYGSHDGRAQHSAARTRRVDQDRTGCKRPAHQGTLL